MYGGHIWVVLDLVQNRLTQGQQDLMTSSCYRQCSRPPLTVGPAVGSQMCQANACHSGGMETMTLKAAVPATPLMAGELSERTVKIWEPWRIEWFTSIFFCIHLQNLQVTAMLQQLWFSVIFSLTKNMCCKMFLGSFLQRNIRHQNAFKKRLAGEKIFDTFTK